MYAQFNRRVEYIYNNSLFKTAVGEVYCIRYDNQPVMFAEIVDVGLVYLEDMSGRRSEGFDSLETSLEVAQALARDMLDDILYLDGRA